MDVSCHRPFLPGTSLEPAVIPTAQASSFTLYYYYYYYNHHHHNLRRRHRHHHHHHHPQSIFTAILPGSQRSVSLTEQALPIFIRIHLLFCYLTYRQHHTETAVKVNRQFLYKAHRNEMNGAYCTYRTKLMAHTALIERNEWRILHL
jgi:hypothetical protein